MGSKVTCRILFIFLASILFLDVSAPFLFTLPALSDITLNDLAPQGAYASGAVVVRPVNIAYRSNEALQLSLQVELPLGWKILVPPESLEFEGAGSEMLLISFHIPEFAPAGDYLLALSATVAGAAAVDAASKVELQLPVSVLSAPGMECLVGEEPDLVLAGNSYQVSFICRNSGNVPLSAAIEVSSSHGFDLRQEKDRIALLPGESTLFGVLVDTPISLTREIRHLLQVKVISRDDSGLSSSAVSILDIIPRTTGTASRYNTLPGESKLLGVFNHTDSDTFGFAATVSGAGYLDDEEATYLSYKLGRPFAGAGSLLPDRSDYFIGVRGDNFKTVLGTQYFALSPLMEASRYGTGMTVGRSFGNLSLEGYGMDLLLTGIDESRTGGKLSYRIGDRGFGAFNMLHVAGREDWTSAGGEVHILTERGARLGLEYASSDAARVDDAMRANLGWSSKNIAVNLKYLHAGPYYEGSVGDRDDFSATLSCRPADSLRIQGVVSSRAYKLVQPIPARLDTVGLVASWNPVPNTSIHLDLRDSLDQDLEQSADAVTRGETVRFGLNRKSGVIEYGMQLDVSRELDFAESLRSYTQGIGIRMNVDGKELGDLAAGMNIRLRDDGDDKAPWSDLNLQWKRSLGPRSFLSLQYRTVNSSQSWYKGSDSLLLSYGLVFPNQGEFSLSANYGPNRSSGNPDDIRLTLSYSHPYTVPVSLKRDRGIVEGKVIDGATGRAIPDVVLRLGDSIAASDSFGTFKFHTLPAGRHRISLDPASLPVDLLPDERLPIEIDFTGGKLVRNITLVKAASLSGKILQYQFDLTSHWLSQAGGEDDEYEEPSGVPGLVLKLEGPQGLIRRAVSGEDGRFRFPPLLPGNWKLSLQDGAVPESHFLAKGDYDFLLSPGEVEETLIRMFPKARRIQFMDSGTITEEPIEVEPEEAEPEEVEPNEEEQGDAPLPLEEQGGPAQ